MVPAGGQPLRVSARRERQGDVVNCNRVVRRVRQVGRLRHGVFRGQQDIPGRSTRSRTAGRDRACDDSGRRAGGREERGGPPGQGAPAPSLGCAVGWSMRQGWPRIPRRSIAAWHQCGEHQGRCPPVSAGCPPARPFAPGPPWDVVDTAGRSAWHRRRVRHGGLSAAGAPFSVAGRGGRLGTCGRPGMDCGCLADDGAADALFDAAARTGRSPTSNRWPPRWSASRRSAPSRRPPIRGSATPSRRRSGSGWRSAIWRRRRRTSSNSRRASAPIRRRGRSSSRGGSRSARSWRPAAIGPRSSRARRRASTASSARTGRTWSCGPWCDWRRPTAD